MRADAEEVPYGGGHPDLRGRRCRGIRRVVGVAPRYGLIFKNFQFLDDSGPGSINALTSGQVQAADIFTTDPWIKADHLVPLTDPRNVFIAENVVPLVYKAGVNATVIGALNAVSARLTLADLLNLDTKIMLDRDSTVAVARDWLTQVGLS
jgi:osmoprotectant transport system substrate-binding protein